MTEPTLIPLGDPDAKKAQIILSVEPAVKELIENIAHKGESYTNKSGTKVEFNDKYENYPEISRKSYIAVLLHYLLKGVKEDMNIEFDRTPYALSEVKGGSSNAGSRSGLSKAKKNDILARQDMKYYASDIESGKITMDDAFPLIQAAWEEKKKWENEGWVLPDQKNKAPVQKGTDEYDKYIKEQEESKATQQKNIEAAQKQLAENRAAGKS